jgi:hypothetical protein
LELLILKDVNNYKPRNTRKQDTTLLGTTLFKSPYSGGGYQTVNDDEKDLTGVVSFVMTRR